jgi:GxxExxY protein
MPENDTLTEAVLKAAFEVHSLLGPGLVESSYVACLAKELQDMALEVQREVSMSIVYKGLVLDSSYRADLIVEQRVVVEVKSVEFLRPVHEAQLRTYMKLGDMPVGLLLNFHVASLRNGIRRLTRFTHSPPRGASEYSPSA